MCGHLAGETNILHYSLHFTLHSLQHTGYAGVFRYLQIVSSVHMGGVMILHAEAGIIEQYTTVESRQVSSQLASRLHDK